MTNLNPIKEKIWQSVKNDNRDDSDKYCLEMQDKINSNLWRIGWNIYPKNIDELINLTHNIAIGCETCWKKAIEEGDTPNEDVSPAEGL